MSGKIFQPFVVDDPKAEVLGKNILLFIECFQGTKNSKLKYLTEAGIIDQEKDIWPQETKWYSEQKWLNAIKLVHDKLGASNLKMISKEIIKKSQLPPSITTLQQAFNSIDAAYHFNNRGDIGYYKLLSYIEKKAIIETNHPYPIPFDEGIFMGLLERFSPSGKTSLALFASIIHKKNLSGTLEYTITW